MDRTVGKIWCIHHTEFREKKYANGSFTLTQLARKPFDNQNPTVGLKGHCIEFKYYADGIHAGLTPPG